MESCNLRTSRLSISCVSPEKAKWYGDFFRIQRSQNDDDDDDDDEGESDGRDQHAPASGKEQNSKKLRYPISTCREVLSPLTLPTNYHTKGSLLSSNMGLCGN